MQYSLVIAPLCAFTCQQLSGGVALLLSGCHHQRQGRGQGLGEGCQGLAVKIHTFGCPAERPMCLYSTCLQLTI